MNHATQAPGRAGDWTETLTGAMLLCELTGRTLYVYPEKAWFDTLLSQDVFADCPFACEQRDVALGLTLLQAWTAAHPSGLSEADFDRLRTDYNNLFVGPHKVLAPPWESVYFSSDRQMFQKETLDVRMWYARFGLEIVNLNREPDDHLGLELEFIAHLLKQSLDALDRNDGAESERLHAALREFMIAHPLRWATKCCDAIVDKAQTDFYRGTALLISGALRELVAVLDIQEK